ncbi:MAG: hypothetical protein ACJ75J_07225 [Cytophagaceae bacterium]
MLILFLLISTIASGQNYLNIRNKNTDEVKMIQTKKTFFFKLNGDSSFTKGVIQQIKDSSVVIYLPNEDENALVEYQISDFSAIRKPSKFHSISRIVSAPLLVVGGVALMAGTIETISPKSSGIGGDTVSTKSNEGPILLGIGAGAMGLGLLPYLIKAKTYDFKKDCILEIKND